MTEKHLQRLRNGFLIFLIVLTALYFGKWSFAAVYAAAFWVGAGEMVAIARNSGASPPGKLLQMLSVACMFSAAHSKAALELAFTMSGVAVLCAFVFNYIVGHKVQATFADVAASFLCLVYTGWFPAHIVLIRSLFGTKYTDMFWAQIWQAQPMECWQNFLAMGADTGLMFAGTTILIPTFTDIAAYYFGKAFGRSKLAAAISPNKTVKGALFGLIVGVAVGMLCVWIAHSCYRYPVNFPVWAAIVVMISLFAQMGDLAESLIKRTAGVKDSGDTIRGHGGILDRFDSHILSATCAYYMWRLVVGVD